LGRRGLDFELVSCAVGCYSAKVERSAPVEKLEPGHEQSVQSSHNGKHDDVSIARPDCGVRKILPNSAPNAENRATSTFSRRRRELDAAPPPYRSDAQLGKSNSLDVRASRRGGRTQPRLRFRGPTLSWILEKRLMRVMLLVKATAESEAGAMPSSELLEAMGK
jgi:hypothetical protein